MKKTFSLIDPSKKPERIADQIRSEVKKYIKRERKKELPKTADFWDFDCRFGISEDSAEEIHVSKISEYIAKMVTEKAESFYLEIIARSTTRARQSE